MLNPFPVQFLSFFAYMLLRLFVGGILVFLGIRHFRQRESLKEALKLSWFPYGALSVWILITVELVVGVLFILGAFTQYAAIVAMLMAAEMLIIRHWFDHKALPTRMFYLLLFGASLTLFITGAGPLAFDLPI